MNWVINMGTPETPTTPTNAQSSCGDKSRLLAVDCGLKTGLALFTLNGQLLWYRSHNFGSRTRLKKAAWSMLKEIDGLSHLVIEGGGELTDIWLKEGKRRGLKVTQVQAELWRKDLLLPRQQRTGKQAKQVSDELAREVIDKSGAAKPTSLRHDAAEAILVGWWVLNNKHKEAGLPACRTKR